MKYIIETIPHSEQRYKTCGDYWTDEDGTNHIVVSDMGDEDFALLVAIHELAEQYLCKKRGIAEPDITAFDIKFEAEKVEDSIEEPGDDVNAPYMNEHCIATAIERLMCAELNRPWKEYEEAVLKLFK